MRGSQFIDGSEADDSESMLFRELLRWPVGGGNPATSEHTGTKALMLAVLEDALRAFLDQDKRVSEESERWMASRRDTWVFSFTTVCQTLGLDPDAVRRAAHRMRKNNISAREVIGRNRPNVRRSGRLTTRRGASKG